MCDVILVAKDVITEKLLNIIPNKNSKNCVRAPFPKLSAVV